MTLTWIYGGGGEEVPLVAQSNPRKKLKQKENIHAVDWLMKLHGPGDTEALSQLQVMAHRSLGSRNKCLVRLDITND